MPATSFNKSAASLETLASQSAYLPAAAMEQPELHESSQEPPAHEPQPSEPARTLQLRLQTWKGAPRVAVLQP